MRTSISILFIISLFIVGCGNKTNPIYVKQSTNK